MASGGGGDAIAAAILGRELLGQADLHIATYSWDRLIVDPLPGPRRPSDFVGLERMGEWNYRVKPTTSVRPPAASTLPRLAGELEVNLYLIDPHHGAVGIARQLDELMGLLRMDALDVVDVGGDIVAEGSEPTLRSPLGDSLTLAAVHQFQPEARILVAGPGLDGELTEHQVLTRCAEAGADQLALSAEAATHYARVFEWHVSEATGLFRVAGLGVRGSVEIRDHGTPIVLTDNSAQVRGIVARDLLSINRVAQALLATASLAGADAAVREVTGRPSELEHERAKAARLATWAAAPDLDAIIERDLAETEGAVAGRGIDFVTLRRLSELLNVSGPTLAALWQRLKALRPDRYLPPLWAVHPGAERLLKAESPSAEII